MRRGICILLFGMAYTLVPLQTRAQDISPKVEELSLFSLDGKRIKFKDVKSKVTVVALWAAWCKPCVRELPYMDALFTYYRKNIQVSVMAINVDETIGHDASSIRKLRKRLKLRIPMLMKPEQKLISFLTTGKLDTSSLFRVMQLPLVAIVDPNGKVLQKIGFEEGISKKEFIEQYKKLVAKALKGFVAPSKNLDQDLGRAMEIADMGNQSEAEEILLGMLAQEPKNAQVMSALSIVYQKMGKIDLALEMIRGVLAIKPASFSPLFVIFSQRVFSF